MRVQAKRAAMSAVVLGLAACGSGSPASSGGSPNPGPSSKQLIIGMINPFSGPDAAFGLDMNAGCVAAVQVINAHGGALGHTFKCVPIDSKGDAADAVPAVSKALAQYSNMVGVIGPGTDAATATMPLLEQAPIVTMGANGDVSFDHNTYKYYWRITPSDAANSVAICVAAHNLGYKRAALVFGNDAGAQTSVPGILHSFPIVGGTVVANESVVPAQPSYQTEAAQVAAAHPDVIFTETDPQTGSTFFGELKQMGVHVPVIGTGNVIIPTWVQAMIGAVGVSDLHTFYSGVDTYAPPGPSFDNFKTALLADRGVDNPGQYQASQFARSYYDSVNLLVLAMIKAHSADPSVYNSDIAAVTTGGKDVFNFAEGAAALQAGTDIRYVGALGPINFDKYHNSSGEFEVVGLNADGTPEEPPRTIITPTELNAAR